MSFLVYEDVDEKITNGEVSSRIGRLCTKDTRVIYVLWYHICQGDMFHFR